MTYDAFREDGGPTLYPSHKTPVTVDVLIAGFVFAAVIFTLSILIILPGYNPKTAVFQLSKMVIGVFVTTTIVVCNYGQEWETAKINATPTQYRAGINEEIQADVAVMIGLRGVNITLKAVPDEKWVFSNSSVNETINYNERFSWDDQGWLQGRLGFGPTAGLFNREYRAGQFKGLPYPILWVAEYFTMDGEGIRWGRFYRQAGWYTHILMWTAFPLWLLSMILFHMVLVYGAILSLLTGACLLVANIIYATLRNPNDLHIPIHDEAVLKFSWGWCFWLNMANGLVCVVIGLVVIILYITCYEAISTYFGLDVLQQYEEYYLDEGEGNAPLVHKRNQYKSTKYNRSQEVNNPDDIQYELEEQTRPSPVTAPASILRRHYRQKDAGMIGRFQISRKVKQRMTVSLPDIAEDGQGTSNAAYEL